MGVTDHPDYRAFVRQIRENPADDTVRLICADWLEEHGEPEWAEFVRVHVELATLPYCTHGAVLGWCRRCELVERRRELIGVDRVREGEWGDNYWRWFASWLPTNVFTVRRGFVDWLETSAAAWVAHGDAVLARQPVERVRLTTAPQIRLWADPSIYGSGVVWWLVGDGEHRRFPDRDVAIAMRADEPRETLIHTALLHLRWPGVAFELPPPLRGQVDWRFTGEAGEDVRAGQPVGRDGDGRVRPFRASVEGVMGADAADEFVTPADELPTGPVTVRLGPDARRSNIVIGRRDA